MRVPLREYMDEAATSPAATAAGWSDLKSRLTSARRRRRVSTAAAAAAAAALVAVVWVGSKPDPVQERLRTQGEGELVRTAVTEREVVHALERGRVRVQVDGDGRVWRFTSGWVEVEVLGTAFVLERTETDVHVEVLEGRVRVTGPKLERVLGVGDRISIARPEPEPAGPWPSSPGPRAQSVDESYDARQPEPEPQPDTEPQPEPRARPRVVARAETQRPPEPAPVDRWAQVDAARARGDSKAALRLLRTIVREGSAPERAVARYTIGVVALEDEGDPAAAEAAFGAAARDPDLHPALRDSARRRLEELEAAPR